jgi:DNA-binding transcriptional LysR family regulator
MHDDLEAERLASVLCPGLTAFAAAGREENLTRAAEGLGMPQPTLSRALARLQDELGIRLFARAGRTVRLTREGRALLPHARGVLAELEAALLAILADDDSETGLVRFSFLRTFRSRAVPNLLRDFRAGHSRVRFQLAQGSTQSILDGIRTEEADLGLVAPVPPGDTRFAVAELHTEPIQLVVPAGSPLACRSHIGLHEVAAEPFIVLLPGYGTRTYTEHLCRRAGFSPRIAFEAEDVALARGLVGAGFGVSLLPPADRGIHDDVAAIPVADAEAVRRIALVWSAERHLSPPAENFRQHLAQHGPRELGSRTSSYQPTP